MLSESAVESRFALSDAFLDMRASRAISRGPIWLSWLGCTGQVVHGETQSLTVRATSVVGGRALLDPLQRKRRQECRQSHFASTSAQEIASTLSEANDVSRITLQGVVPFFEDSRATTWNVPADAKACNTRLNPALKECRELKVRGQLILKSLLYGFRQIAKPNPNVALWTARETLSTDALDVNLGVDAVWILGCSIPPGSLRSFGINLQGFALTDGEPFFNFIIVGIHGLLHFV
jgi:hypothetical protein